MTIQEFLNSSYTAYHATANVVELFKANGFEEVLLNGKKKWSLARGGKYFVTRNGSAVVAFVVGEHNIFNVCESHTDSPCFKVKGGKLFESEGVKRLNTEAYGSGLLYTYFDRPLKIAGRVLLETANGIEQKLVASDYNVVIPSLCIHHNPTANDSLSINPQIDALPMLAQGECDLYASLADGKVIDADLYVVPVEQAFTSGINGEFLSSPRIDNLTSVYSSIQALLHACPESIAVVACLDNEEIGSGTRQGSPNFINQVLNAITEGLGMSCAEGLSARENGMVLSIDNGQASHPAHPEKSDPLNRAYLNGGVLIKHHTNYATDGLTSAIFKRMLDMVGVKYQDYYNRSDLRCGRSLGVATSGSLGMKTCDVGLAQLAMHSACETCGMSDIIALQRALTAFLCAYIRGTDTTIIETKQF